MSPLSSKLGRHLVSVLRPRAENMLGRLLPSGLSHFISFVFPPQIGVTLMVLIAFFSFYKEIEKGFIIFLIEVTFM